MALDWAGRDWEVVEYQYAKGPGPNFWGGTVCVTQDADGRLHLTIKEDPKKPGRWLCAAVKSPVMSPNKAGYGTYPGYGTYTWWVDTDISSLPVNVMFGLFLYECAHCEYDFEASTWKYKPNTQHPYPGRNAQYVAQPYSEKPCGYLHSFDLKPADKKSTHRIVWTPGGITIASWEGHPDPLPKPIAPNTYDFPFTKHHALYPESTKVYMNLWVRKQSDLEVDSATTAKPGDWWEKHGGTPYPAKEVEVVLKKFEYSVDTPTYCAASTTEGIKEQHIDVIDKPPLIDGPIHYPGSRQSRQKSKPQAVR